MTDTQALEEVLEETRAEIRRAQADVDRVRQDLAKAEHRLSDLESEERGLMLALKRRRAGGVGEQQERLEVADDDEEPQPETDITDLPRTDAIVRVLADHPAGLSPAGIRDELARRGRADEYQVISAALQHLKSQGRVTSPKRGLYLAAAQQEVSAKV